jgi:hypothetical protein
LKRPAFSSRTKKLEGLASVCGESRSERGAQPNLVTVANDLAVRRALEAAGVIFIDENGDAGPGVRLRKRQGNRE